MVIASQAKTVEAFQAMQVPMALRSAAAPHVDLQVPLSAMAYILHRFLSNVRKDTILAVVRCIYRF